MKKKIAILLLTLLILAVPGLHAKAAAVPPGGITTTVEDADYIDQNWLTQALILTLNDQSWAMSLEHFRNYPVYLNGNGENRSCVLGDASVIDVFLQAINDQLRSAPQIIITPVYDNQAGSFIQRTDEFCVQLNGNVKLLILNELQRQFAAGSPHTITLVLTDAYVIRENTRSSLSFSSDFAVAGSCTTSFRGSSSNRVNNIQVAGGRINNMVLLPGQEISVSAAFLPRTAENGYLEAGAYLNGETIQALGGGICQVSSTIYNAVKNAGLTVLERHPHSMPVHYLPLGLDAAISSGAKDLRFRNNYSSPVILQAYTEGKNLTVNCLVSNQELAGRTFKLWASQTGPLSAKTYFTTYQDGQEVSTVYVGTSRYMEPKETN